MKKIKEKRKMNEMMSVSAKADLELVEVLRKENGIKAERAFSTLFNKYHDMLMFHYRRLIRDEEIVKEILLDAFMKMSKNINRFDEGAAAFSTWLFKLTHNLFIDEMRKKKDAAILLTDMATINEDTGTIEYDIPSPDKNPEMKLLGKEKAKRIRDIIGKMEDEEYARIIKLRFFDGLTYEEISKAVDKPLGTVKAILFRAKKVLKQDLINAKLNLE